MNKKTEIKALLKAVSEEWQASQLVINRIRENKDYTPEAAEEKVAAEKQRMSKFYDERKAAISTIVDGKLKELFKTSSADLDGVYQARLANVMKILSLSGENIDERDVEQMIAPFKRDYTALKGISSILESKGITSLEVHYALQGRKDNERKLINFKSSIENLDIYDGVQPWANSREYLGYDEFLQGMDDDMGFSYEVSAEAGDDGGETGEGYES